MDCIFEVSSYFYEFFQYDCQLLGQHPGHELRVVCSEFDDFSILDRNISFNKLPLLYNFDHVVLKLVHAFDKPLKIFNKILFLFVQLLNQLFKEIFVVVDTYLVDIISLRIFFVYDFESLFFVNLIFRMQNKILHIVYPSQDDSE